MTKEEKIQNALLDLILANKEELALAVKSGNSLGCRDCKIVDFRDKISKVKDHSHGFKGEQFAPLRTLLQIIP